VLPAPTLAAGRPPRRGPTRPPASLVQARRQFHHLHALAHRHRLLLRAARRPPGSSAGGDRAPAPAPQWARPPARSPPPGRRPARATLAPTVSPSPVGHAQRHPLAHGHARASGASPSSTSTVSPSPRRAPPPRPRSPSRVSASPTAPPSVSLSASAFGARLRPR
jgi:hypothetical protein